MKTKQEILDALENGNYEIRHEENCGCSFDWKIREDRLDDGCDSDECWEGMILYVDDQEIAQHVRYNMHEILWPYTKIMREDDIDEDIWDEMQMSDMCEQGESENCDTHENKRKDSLVEWLTKQKEAGYRLMRDNDRGFANEYTMLLIAPTASEDDDELGNVDDWDELSPEDWAREYLYRGDASTIACVRFSEIF